MPEALPKCLVYDSKSPQSFSLAICFCLFPSMLSRKLITVTEWGWKGIHGKHDFKQVSHIFSTSVGAFYDHRDDPDYDCRCHRDDRVQPSNV